ncbi:MAG: M1 family aminopeptidase [Candidatus Dormibacteria bacterium]
MANIRHTRLELRVDPHAGTLAGTATHSLTPIARPLRRLPLNLVELTVDRVTLNGKALEFDHREGVLEVKFKTPVPVGREVEVSIQYHGSPRTGLNFTAPDPAYPDRPVQAWSQGQDEYARYWFPNHDFPNQKQTTEVIVEAPAEFETISNGTLLGVIETGGWKRWHWSQEVPHVSYLVSLVVGKFDRWGEEADGVPLDYYVPPGRMADGHRAFDETPAMMRVLGELAGTPYPYTKYASVVVQDFTWGGMENTSATTFIDDLLPDERAAPDQDSGGLVSHELAHQWFGDLLTCREWAHGWLNEGFATYAWPYYAERAYGMDEAQRLHLQHADSYFAEDRTYRRPIVNRTYTEATELFDTHLYEKGSWVLWMLRHLLGDDTFAAGVHEYVRRNRQGLVVTEDLVRAMEDTSGRALGWFFDQWVYGGGHPEIEVRYSWNEDDRVASMRVRQTQKLDDITHVFRAPVRLAFGLGKGEVAVHEVEVGRRGAHDSFTFKLPRRPRWVRFDQGNHLLKTLDFPRDDDLLIAQLAEDEVTGRVEAAKQLGRRGSPAAVKALTEALQKDEFWFVRASAATALGVAQGADARDALLAGLEQPQGRVRAAAAAGLGAFVGDEAATAGLLRTLRKDRSYSAAAAAAAALGHARAATALPDLLKAADRPSHRESVAAGALRGLAELRDPAQLGAILERARPGRDQRLRAAALVSAASLAVPSGREAREVVRDAAEQALRDPLYFVRRGATRALADLGDPAAIPALQATIDREVEGAVRYACRVAIDSIQRSADTDASTGTLRDDVEELRRANRELRERVDRLDAPRRKGKK